MRSSSSYLAFGGAFETSTTIAGAEDLQVMTDFTKSVLCRNCIGPALDCRAGHLDRTTAVAADQMVVVAGRAAAIRGLTVAGTDGVQITYVGHQLQRAIDRGQSDAFPVMSQIIVNLLRGSEVVSIRQDLLDRRALPSFTLHTGRFRRLGFRNRPGRHLATPWRRRPGLLSVHRNDQHGQHADDLRG